MIQTGSATKDLYYKNREGAQTLMHWNSQSLNQNSSNPELKTDRMNDSPLGKSLNARLTFYERKMRSIE